jgi:hypothetical protein
MNNLLASIVTGTITYYVCKNFNHKHDAFNIATNIAVAAVVASVTNKIIK